MLDPASQAQLKEVIADCISTDQGVLDALREEIRPLKSATRHIQPRATTSISLVGTDGGNNQLQSEPFLIQLIRAVDSSNNEHCLEAVSPTTPIQKLNARQFSAGGSARCSPTRSMASRCHTTRAACKRLMKMNADFIAYSHPLRLK